MGSSAAVAADPTHQSAMNDLDSRIRHARSTVGRDRDDLPVSVRNIGAALARRAQAAPDRPFLTCLDDDGAVDHDWTASKFLADARRVAGYLTRSLKLGVGDRIATLTGNRAETVLLYVGAWLAGITVVPVNVTEDDTRIRFVLENAQVKVAFAGNEHVHRLTGAVCHIDNAAFVGNLENCPSLDPLPDLAPDTEALIVYTSGTTGAPKGVVLEHQNLLVDAHAIANWHRFDENDRALCVLPIHHVNGTVVTLMTPLYSGGSVVLARKFSASRFWSAIAEHKITWCSVVPTLLAFLCEKALDREVVRSSGRGAGDGDGDTVSSDLTTSRSDDLTLFRHFICGAGPLTTGLARRFHETFGVRVVHGYGLSETTCYSSFLPIDLDETEYRSWMFERGFPSIGVPLPENEMAIQDECGHPLPPGARGEIVIRGHTVMRGYFARPDANEAAFTFGWFRSGDEGFYELGDDNRPYFFITGRLKELIIRGGVNYAPLEIDEALAGIVGVKAAMAVGFEHDLYGEEIGAYVQKEPGALVSAADVLAHCARTLPFAKRPKVVIFGDDFPVTSTGKYQRNRLKERFAAYKSAEFKP